MANRLLFGQRLDQRQTRDRIGMDQRGAAEVDQGRDLLGCQDGTGLVFECPECLDPGHRTAGEKQDQQYKRPPEKAERHRGPPFGPGSAFRDVGLNGCSVGRSPRLADHVGERPLGGRQV